jgi:hypothetical protein
MVSDQEIEKCLDYLRDTAEDYAKWRSAEKYYEKKLKQIEACKFMEEEKGSVEAKRMAARSSEEYVSCLEDYKESCYYAELLLARRTAAQLKISWAQTERKSSIGSY